MDGGASKGEIVYLTKRTVPLGVVTVRNTVGQKEIFSLHPTETRRRHHHLPSLNLPGTHHIQPHHINSDCISSLFSVWSHSFSLSSHFPHQISDLPHPMFTAFALSPPIFRQPRFSTCSQRPRNLYRLRCSANPPGREEPYQEDTSKVATLDRDTERSFDTVLQELTAIQQDGPRNVAILGTRYTPYLHQQIIELLTYANVLVGNHVFTSGAAGTNAAVIRGALRAEKPDLLTVVLPQSLGKQSMETQDQLKKVTNLIEMKKNDPLPLDVASQLCNSDILSRCTHFIAFAFHDSDTVLESVKQAKQLRIVVTVLYLD